MVMSADPAASREVGRCRRGAEGGAVGDELRGPDPVGVFTGLADLPEGFGDGGHAGEAAAEFGGLGAEARYAAEFLFIADVEIAARAGGERAGGGERALQDTPGAAVVFHEGELAAGVVEARGADERGVKERRGCVLVAAETAEKRPTAFIVGRGDMPRGGGGDHQSGEPAAETRTATGE